MSVIPEWVLKYKQPQTEIKVKNNKFYLYEVSSKWDKEKKRAQKKSGAYLGCITLDGFIPKHRTYSKSQAPNEKSFSNIAVKEYGASSVIYNHLGKSISEKLQEIFPENWREILVISILRVIHQCPMKNIKCLYDDSYLSHLFEGLKLSGKEICYLMQNIGRQRDKIVYFMQHFIEGSENIVFDMTDVISASKKLGINALGKVDSGFDIKINLLYLFSVDKASPLYYRVLPGNIKDVSSLKLSIQEIGIDKVIIVVDKGFVSKENIEMLKSLSVKFIMPLRRDNAMIQYKKLIKNAPEKLDGHFIFEGRCIWHYAISLKNEDLKIFVFLDDKLRCEERNDYLVRLEKKIEGYTEDDFFSTQIRFGTLSIAVPLKGYASAQEVYRGYKARMQVENVFDAFKNVLEADRTYASSLAGCEAWMFFNHIAMMFLYDLYRRLSSSDLLIKYSAQDILMMLSQIRMLKIKDTWVVSESTKKLSENLKKMSLDLLPI
jgi:transposase